MPDNGLPTFLPTFEIFVSCQKTKDPRSISCIQAIMDDTTLSNGTLTPQTPKLNSLALTEYTANPTPPSRRNSPTASPKVPEAFLLPNGFPDVRIPSREGSNHLIYGQYLRLILTSRVYEVVNETPLTHAINLSNRLECRVLLKREDLQPVFSFKLRGAYNKMAHLNPQERWKGVVACSAGAATSWHV